MMSGSQKKNKPFVSIVMPTYNRAHFISESLDSILQQTFQDWECLIIDDGSTDNTKEVLEPYLASDDRFKYFVRPNHKKKGANSCRNYGLEKASGEFVHWFDSDDIAHPDYLKISLDLIKKHNVDFCRFSRITFRGDFQISSRVKEKNFRIEKVNYLSIEKLLKNELSFNTCNVIWKKSVLGTERFNENIVYADEWEYYSRLLANGLQGVSIDYILFFGRKHEGSTTYEFHKNDPIRKASKIKAVRLVAQNLKIKGLWTPSLKKYFIQMAFSLKSFSLLNHLLKQTDAGTLKKLKYKLGYVFYPVLRPVFKLKGKVLDTALFHYRSTKPTRTDESRHFE